MFTCIAGRSHDFETGFVLPATSTPSERAATRYTFCMSDESTQAGTRNLHTESIEETSDQLSLLQTAAEDLANTRTIDDETRAAVAFAAHKLARSLADAGFTDAAIIAQEIVAALNHAGLPQPERFHQQVNALRDALASNLEP